LRELRSRSRRQYEGAVVTGDNDTMDADNEDRFRLAVIESRQRYARSHLAVVMR